MDANERVSEWKEKCQMSNLSKADLIYFMSYDFEDHELVIYFHSQIIIKFLFSIFCPPLKY